MLANIQIEDTFKALAILTFEILEEIKFEFKKRNSIRITPIIPPNVYDEMIIELISDPPPEERPFEILSDNLIVTACGIPISDVAIKIPAILMTMKTRLNSDGGNNLDKIRFVIKRQPLITMLPCKE